MAYETILLDIANGIGRLTLNRPDSLNAVNSVMGHELYDALKKLAAEESVRVVVLTGAGRAFSSGGDIKDMTLIGDQRSTEFFSDLIGTLNKFVLLLGEIRQPVVAAINGPAAGVAFNFALACDLRIAAKSATFNQAFVKIGLVPDGGGSYLLPRLIGWSRATEMILTGRMVQTDEALQIGLVHQVVEDAELAATVEMVAARLAQAPTATIGHAKQLLRASQTNSFAAQLQLELETQLLCGASADFHEGITAFVEKRKPQFKGK